MLKIRLTRMGRRNRPFFRVVVADARSRRDGRYLENLGYYDPLIKEPEKKLMLKTDRYLYWLKTGAQPSESLARLVKHTKILERQATLPPEPPASAPKEEKAKK